MDVAVFHAFAQVFQSDLDEETCNDPLAGIAIHEESLRQEVQKTQAQKKGAAEREKQRHVLLEPVTQPFSHQATRQSDEDQCDACNHAVAK